MPSLATRLVSFILRKTGTFRKLYSGGPSFPDFQAKALATPSEPGAKIRAGLKVERTEFQGRAIWEISPKVAVPSTAVLYWHGGGYVYPAADAHWAFFAHMAKEHGWRMIVPLYPLAPMAQVEEVSAFAFDLYRQIAEREGAGSLVMGGDSAGGGLAAVTAMAARDAGLPLPAKLLLICPWLDASPDKREQAQIEPRDAILTIRGIREAGLMYAGAVGTRDPRVSPIHAEWQALPPILAFGGGDDILVVDARALKQKLPEIDYVEEAGMIHDWPIFTFSESRKAQARMAEFVAA